jgi:hypothetical protein
MQAYCLYCLGKCSAACLMGQLGTHHLLYCLPHASYFANSEAVSAGLVLASAARKCLLATACAPVRSSRSADMAASLQAQWHHDKHNGTTTSTVTLGTLQICNFRTCALPRICKQNAAAEKGAQEPGSLQGSRSMLDAIAVALQLQSEQRNSAALLFHTISPRWLIRRTCTVLPALLL